MSSPASSACTTGSNMCDTLPALYETFDPGSSSTESPNSPRPCSPEFLDTILADLRAIRDEAVLNYHSLSWRGVEACLKTIISECDRLRHQTELFTSVDAHELFFAAVHRHVNQIVDIIKDWRRREDCHHACLMRSIKSRERATRPTFKPGKKPWNQFLGNGAPALPAIAREKRKLSSLQVIPPAGNGILSAWTRECKDVMSSLDENKNGAPVYVPAISVREKRTTRDNGALRTIGPHSFVPSPFTSHTKKIRSQSFHSLEDLAADLVTSSQMQQYLASQSPEQIAAIITALQVQTPAAQAQAPTAQTQIPAAQGQIAAPPAQLSAAQAQADSSRLRRSKQRALITAMNKARAAATVTRATQRGPIAALAANSAKRPLNSWMAFRSYYSGIFISQQQKDISGLLTILWQSDPFKAKWSILAKAYSLIRDYKGKHLAPLDIFLALACPHIGIIGPGDYFAVLGWEIVIKDGERSMIRLFEADMNAFDEHIRSTNLSVEDVIGYCHEVGYIVDDELEGIGAGPATGRAGPSMAMAAHPTAASGGLGEEFTIRRRAKVARRARSRSRRADAATSSLSVFPVGKVAPTQMSLAAQNAPTHVAASTTACGHPPALIPGYAGDWFNSDMNSSSFTAPSTEFTDLHPQTTHTGTQSASDLPAPANSVDFDMAAAFAAFESAVAPPQNGTFDAFDPANNFWDDNNGSGNIAAGSGMLTRIEQLHDMQDQYPFNGQFDPAADFAAGLTFDPADGDCFNTYNISHFDASEFIDPNILHF